MSWFITTIYSKNPFNNQRCFGYYNSYNEAKSAVNKNCGDMHECLYDYLVMEKIKPGIFADVISSKWFKWKHNKWQMIDKVPNNLKKFTNWSIG